MKKILILFLTIALLAVCLAVSLSACGTKTPTEGLEIEVRNDSYAVVKGIGSAENATEIIIPSIYQGVPVTRIGSRAFRGCLSLTSITIPKSVTAIGKEAFLSCSSLKSINIPDSVTTIGDRVFVNCLSLTSITIPESVATIGDYAFSDCSSLKSINIPDGVTKIGTNAFAGCNALVRAEFKNSNGWSKNVSDPAEAAEILKSGSELNRD